MRIVWGHNKGGNFLIKLSLTRVFNNGASLLFRRELNKSEERRGELLPQAQLASYI
jgi:hypothetical protein